MAYKESPCYQTLRKEEREGGRERYMSISLQKSFGEAVTKLSTWPLGEHCFLDGHWALSSSKQKMVKVVLFRAITVVRSTQPCRECTESCTNPNPLCSALGKLEGNQEEISVLIGNIGLVPPELRCALNPELVKIEEWINQRACMIIPQSYKSPGGGWASHQTLVNLTWIFLFHLKKKL